MSTGLDHHRRIAKRIGRVDRSQIRRMFDEAQQLDDDLVHLEIGEPDFDTPEHIVNAANEAARNGETHYSSNAGLYPLREAIADATAASNGPRYDPETDIVVTTGAMEALYLAMLITVDPGQKVIIPTPAWPNYRAQATLVDGVPVEVPLDAEAGFALDVPAMRDAIDDDTAAVVLCSPSNPTGRVYDRDGVREIAAIAREHDAYVIADEVYQGLTYDGPKGRIGSQVVDAENVLTVESVSKKYAMTGWRVGWLAGPEPIVSAATKIHESTTACASTPSQYAALEAITGDQEPISRMKHAFEDRRNYVYDRLSSIDGISCHEPEGAFYVFVDVSRVFDSSQQAVERLLYDYGVVTAPGDGFGAVGEGWIRLSFANSRQQLERGLDRIEALLAEARV